MTNLAPQFSDMFAAQHLALVQPGPVAVLSESEKQTCAEVSRYWNHVLTPGTDDSQYWKVCQPGEIAVCHDYAVTKLNDLLCRGLARGALALAWCMAEFGGHVVLLARCTDGLFVLDNLDDALQSISYDDTYDWRGQEEFGNPMNWAAVER